MNPHASSPLTALLSAPLGIAVLSRDLRFTQVNPALAAPHGTTPEALTGETLRDGLPQFAASLEPALRQVLETGEALQNLEVSGAGSTAGRTWLTHLQPIRDGESVTGVTVIALETTRQRRAERRYRTLFESATQGFCVLELLYDVRGAAVDYRFLETNPAFERHTGLTNAVGKTARQLVPDLEQHWVDIYAQVASGGEARRFEQGSAVMGRFFEVEAIRVGDPEDRHVALIFTDVSAARLALAAERDLARLDAYRVALSDALHNLEDPLEVQRTAAQVLKAQLGADRVFYSDVQDDGEWFVNWDDQDTLEPSILGTRRLDAFGEPVISALRQNHSIMIADTATDERLSPSERTNYAALSLRAAICVPLVKDGSLAHLLSVHSATPRVWSAEELHIAVETAQRTRAAVEQVGIERALRESETRLQRALEASRAGSWEYDPLTRELLYDGNFGALFGRAPGPGRINASELAALTPEGERGEGLETVRAALAGGPGSEFETEFRVRAPEQPERWVIARGRSETSVDGQLRITGTIFEITAIKRAELQMRAINEAQQRFVSDAAHEFRTPLTVIRGNLSLLVRYPEMPLEDRLTAAREAEHEVGRLARLLTDSLAAARGQAQARSVVDGVRLDLILADAWRVAQTLSQRHRFDLGDLAPCAIQGDPDGLRQMVLALLDNAVKYTPDGGTVHLELRLEPGWAEVRVRDTGPGIAAEELERVFERFYRIDRSRTRSDAPGGSGLGLTIARQIAEAHGGSVRLESVLGAGTLAIARLSL